MCGICGIYDRRGLIDKRLLRRMTRTMLHRGPDDEGYFVEKNIGMGMRRLSIIDLKTGKQPISNEEGTATVVFNGEIYNFRELREELEKKGHRFETNADTEVIVHAYEQYGTDCPKLFNGMFAFSLWDSERQQLFIARDRLGIKPLYYHLGKDVFVYGSELKAMLPAGIPTEIDLEAVHHYLGYEYVPAPRTIYKSVCKLLPGHSLVFDATKHTITVQKYWDCRYDAKEHSEERIIEELLKSLKDSVRVRLVSDVPLGAFLSGGIDSSMIVGLMSGLMDEPVKTFSIGFADASYNELPHARKVAELFATDHTEKTVEPDAVKMTQELVRYFDEPFADTSALPTYLVSQLARTKVTVSLSGDGGDELFAGYERYVASSLSRFYSRMLGRPLSGILPPVGKKKGLVNMLQRFNEGLLLPEKARHMRWQYFMSPALASALYTPKLRAAVRSLDWFEPVNRYYLSQMHRLDREQYSDLKLYLPDDILVKVDRMSMASSLEARVPFLDHRFVGLAMTLPQSMRLSGLTTKYILKKAARRILPRDIVNRKKEGFSIPVKNWLRHELKGFMQETLDKPFFVREGLMRQEPIDRMIQSHVKGKKNHSHQLYSLMMLELWHRNNEA